jgi:glycosyltransferase involved in cell wall biosynthesis
MKVGILIPCYNEEEYITEAVNSALNQTYENYRIYISDDRSTDNSWEIIKELRNDKISSYRLTSNKGIAFAMNNAANRAIKDDCDFVFVFGADDILESNTISEVIKKQVETSSDFVVAPYRIFGEKDHLHIPPENLTFADIKRLNNLSGFTLYSARLWSKLKGYSKAYIPISKSSIEDWDLLTRAIRNNYKYSVAKETWVNHRYHKGQETKKLPSQWNQLIKIFNENINAK